MEAGDAVMQPVEACSAATVGELGGDQSSPKAGKLRPRPRKKTKGSYRVHWDEQIIAEHDKERGTRQKIDEPDTPFIRSPQTASDSEGGVLSSDDEHCQHRLSWRADEAVYGRSCSSKAVPVPNPSEAAQSSGDPHNGGGMVDVWHKDVTNRLNDWVLGKTNRRRSTDSCSVGSSDCGAAVDEHNGSHTSSACSSRSSSSAPHWRGLMVPLSSNESALDGKKHDRRISLPEDSPQPKPSSDKFKAKRAQHYNEVAALKAFKKKFVSGEYSSPESDTSDEDKQETCGDVRTKTNTNTNLNQTLSKAVEWTGHSGEACSTPSASEKGQKKKKQLAAKQSAAQTDSDASHAASSEQPEQGTAGQVAAQSSRRSSVSFSGESGGESSEEFRTHRNRHYAREWPEDRGMAAQVSSLETNTNTNINAGSVSVADKRGSQRPNPMEAGRPPVHFGADSEGGDSQSEEFRAQRQQHYNEVAAVRRFREEQTPDAEPSESSSEEEPAADGGEASRASHAAANPCNPMEPRDSGVAFQESSPTAGAMSPSGQTRSHARGSEEEAAWRDKRAAHYSEMAAALRNMPPPSDEEDSDSD